MKTNRQKLSRELLLALRILERSKMNLPCSLTDMVEDLKLYCSKQTISRAQDILDDQGILGYQWIQRDDNRWYRNMYILPSAIGYVELIPKILLDE